MKRLTTLLMTLMLMSTALWADETITVSANSSDISEGLDLKVVAKLFAEAKDLEQFEMMLNNPDSAFCNLDLNGDGQVDYLRVVETGEGRKRLIVLQAILAKDIYQDVASIYVEKDEADNVTVQIVGDEYIYGTNYIIEPVYVYRPVIYDWFWSPAWYAWYSPWYWGYYPGWWYVHSCWACDRYWAHCYAFHHCHYGCSFRTGRSVRRGYVEMQSDVTRRDYATANPDRSFSQRNSGLTNARELRRTSGAARTEAPATAQTRSSAAARTFDSRTTAVARTSGAATARTSGTAARAQSSTAHTSDSRTSATATRSSGTTRASGSATSVRSTGTATATRTSSATRTTGSTTASTTRSSGTATRSTATTARTAGSTTRTTASSTRASGTSTRSTGTVRSSSSTYSGATRSSGSTYSGTTRSGGSTYSGGGSVSRGGGGGFSGGGGGGGGRTSGTVRR